MRRQNLFKSSSSGSDMRWSPVEGGYFLKEILLYSPRQSLGPGGVWSGKTVMSGSVDAFHAV